MNILIFIPARYHSTRFPGKPLALLSGQSMLQRVWKIALQAKHNCLQASQQLSPTMSIDILVGTEDQRIIDHCVSHQMQAILTTDQCDSGTQRAAIALNQTKHQADYIINLQGDNALCPPWFVESIIQSCINTHTPSVITPYVKLDWAALDRLRTEKNTTPFSGTCVVMGKNQQAFWFSKNIIPAIRNEQQLRATTAISPVARHIGLYAYHQSILQDFNLYKPTEYETYEGLEQLKFLANAIPIQMVEVNYQGRTGMTGIDSPEDLQRAETLIAIEGELTP